MATASWEAKATEDGHLVLCEVNHLASKISSYRGHLWFPLSFGGGLQNILPPKKNSGSGGQLGGGSSLRRGPKHSAVRTFFGRRPPMAAEEKPFINSY